MRDPTASALRCNGELDCGDSSDEKASDCCEDGIQGMNNFTRECEKKGDPSTKFYVCKNWVVIKNNFLCDGNTDCIDGSDEIINGTNPICSKCDENSGELIASASRCNGVNDCADNSDEKASDCCQGWDQGVNNLKACEKKGSSSTLLFVCEDSHVLQNDSICNGKFDCGDRSDEKASDCCQDGFIGLNRKCEKKGSSGTTFFVCEDNYVLQEASLCNGELDCGDASDEKASDCCEGGIQGMNNFTRGCEKKGDPSTKFYVCKDGVVIKKNYLCDDKTDCIDGSDEIINGTNPICSKCDENSGELIASASRCNAVNDCADSSDEKASDCCEGGLIGLNRKCEKKGSSSTTFFVCGDNYVIQESSLCNGELDCSDSSDEIVNGTNPVCFDCGVDNGGHIVSESHCNGEFDCINGMDESLNCPTEYSLGALAAGAALFAAGVGYAAMLIKNKNKKSIKSTSAWLLSPFTNTMNYLLSFCGYNKSSTIEDTEEKERMHLNVVTNPESELETGACLE